MNEINEQMNNAAEEPIAMKNDMPKVNFEQKLMAENPIVGNVVTAVIASLVTAVVVAGAQKGFQAASDAWKRFKDNRNARKAAKAKVVVGSDNTVK